MLLIIGYDENSIERERNFLRKYGYPTFGCLCRDVLDFPYLGITRAILLQKPVSVTKTNYILNQIKEAYPSMALLVRLNPLFTREDSLMCPAITDVIDSSLQLHKMLRLLRESGYLYPKEVCCNGIYRHILSEMPLIRDTRISLTAQEYTLLSFVLLYPDLFTSDMIRAACFSILREIPDNTVVAAIARLNKDLKKNNFYPLIKHAESKHCYRI